MKARMLLLILGVAGVGAGMRVPAFGGNACSHRQLGLGPPSAGASNPLGAIASAFVSSFGVGGFWQRVGDWSVSNCGSA